VATAKVVERCNALKLECQQLYVVHRSLCLPALPNLPAPVSSRSPPPTPRAALMTLELGELHV
jgi:hypothetical protein